MNVNESTQTNLRRVGEDSSLYFPPACLPDAPCPCPPGFTPSTSEPFSRSVWLLPPPTPLPLRGRLAPTALVVLRPLGSVAVLRLASVLVPAERAEERLGLGKLRYCMEPRQTPPLPPLLPMGR